MDLHVASFSKRCRDVSSAGLHFQFWNTSGKFVITMRLHTKDRKAEKCFQFLRILYFFPREARLINLSGRPGPSGAKPREFERKIYLYICVYVYIFEGVRTVAWQQ